MTAGGAVTTGLTTAVYALNIYIPLAMFIIMLLFNQIDCLEIALRLIFSGQFLLFQINTEYPDKTV